MSILAIGNMMIQQVMLHSNEIKIVSIVLTLWFRSASKRGYAQVKSLLRTVNFPKWSFIVKIAKKNFVLFVTSTNATNARN